ncbi:hypothetical protein [Pseudorhodobacter wandonensis]|uniref:hypothetical protein n=1 Tax=Pseudorhodobacter wandonensis TaxID=1120568 RepID=UPI00067B4A9C|nr:hypothetical protein [Pseudorhodobacter wandonensis]
MKLTLIYEGPLKGNSAGTDEKGAIRHALSPQLSNFWQGTEFLRDWKNPEYWLPTDYEGLSLSQALANEHLKYGVRFVPLAFKKLNLKCRLKITLLAAQNQFTLMTSGDLDNRVKTLVDGLHIPASEQEMSDFLKSQYKEAPLYCLMADDDQITEFSVRQEVLWSATQEDFHKGIVKAIIEAEVYPALVTIDGTVFL